MSLAYRSNIILLWGCDANSQGTTALTGSKGTFPDASNPLPFNTTCQWNVTAPQGKVLRIEMRSASFRRSCSEQYLKIFDGPSARSTMIVEYCDDSVGVGDYLISTGQSLWVELKAGTLAYTLEVFYETLEIEDCSINVTLDAPQWPEEHNFSSPYWPHGYRINSTCGWYIKAPEGRIVKLQIESELKGSRGKLQAYDVEDSKLSLIARSTGDPNIIYSKLRVLHVLFESFGEMTNLYSAKGLFASFTAIYPGKDCSRSNSEEQNMNIVLTNSSGIFKTPGFPSHYPHDLINQCVWKIIAPRGNVIRIAFSSIQLYQFDCVVVVDGINNVFPVEIARRCGLKVSLTIYTSGREAEIRGIKGLTRSTGPGFHVNYTMVPAASSGSCIMEQNSSMQLTGEGRTFYSPSYPANPGRGMCSWNVTVPDGMFVKLVLTMKQCDQSYVEIYDGTNSTSKSLGQFCNMQEKAIYSSGNSLLVRFVSNSEHTSNVGVLASYVAIAAIPASYACSQNTKSERPIVLNRTHNTFASYDFPLNYPDGAQCEWRIESPDTSIVQITFHSFDLQRSRNCRADYVELRQGRFIWRSTLIGRFCGSSLPSVITSNYSAVFVKFVSDMLGRYQGFRATAVAIPNPAMGACKVQGVDNVIRLTNETGRLFSPLFPRPYPKDMTCTWIINVPEGHFVRLRMKSFRLFIDCDDSDLEIRDGESSSSTLLNQFCSRDYYISVFSSGRYMWVRFRSLRSVSSLDEAGFDAVFEAVKQVPASFSCIASNLKTTLTLDSGSLASYNYPLDYDDPVECVWIIRVSTNRRIHLSFDSFNVSASGSSCDDDYVEVRDGQFDTSDLVGKYCGAEKPPKITSNHWDLRVVFKSSGKARYPGFKASYETERTDKTVETLKIVGICLGVLSVVCTVIGASCKYCKSSRDHVGQETGEGGLENAHISCQEDTTTF